MGVEDIGTTPLLQCKRVNVKFRNRLKDVTACAETLTQTSLKTSPQNASPRIPHTAVWGSVQVLAKKQCPVTLRKSPTRQCGDRFKSFLKNSARSHFANPPHGS